MRVAIASRIFFPEPSAASVRLEALAEALKENGHEVTVLTVNPPGGLHAGDNARDFEVRRVPVLRDRAGYVRGYLQYMSFDIPLFFRLLLMKQMDLIVVEPPPTTGFFTRFAARLRRTPYVYYAADIWSDAASQTGAASIVVGILRRVEVWVLGGARLILAVSGGVKDRLWQLGVTSNVVEIGNGIDTRVYGSAGGKTDFQGRTIVYAGTASEWHGAEVLIDAFAQVREQHVDARLVFIGGGSEKDRLRARTVELGIAAHVDFLPVVAPSELAEHLRGAVVSVATCRPGAGYDFAFPTKLYSSAACGVPVVFAGPGPAREFVSTVVQGAPIGAGVEWSPDQLAGAISELMMSPASEARRAQVAEWAKEAVSIQAPAHRAVSAIEGISRRKRK